MCTTGISFFYFTSLVHVLMTFEWERVVDFLREIGPWMLTSGEVHSRGTRPRKLLCALPRFHFSTSPSLSMSLRISNGKGSSTFYAKLVLGCQ
jgi:hypothetical protein